LFEFGDFQVKLEGGLVLQGEDVREVGRAEGFVYFFFFKNIFFLRRVLGRTTGDESWGRKGWS
jgi:hypothetical protein